MMMISLVHLHVKMFLLVVITIHFGDVSVSDACPETCDTCPTDCADDDDSVAPFGCAAAVATFGCSFAWGTDGSSLISDFCPESCDECESDGCDSGVFDCEGVCDGTAVLDCSNN